MEVNRRTTAYRVTTTGQDNWQPVSRSGLTREEKHGRLLPMDRPEGEPSIAGGVALLAGGLGLTTAALWLLSLLMETMK